MALFDKRHGRGRKGDQITRGVANSSGAATFGVSSQSEMAAKAPAGAKIVNNHIVNSMYDEDTRYPGAGSVATSWAGWSAGSEDYNRGEGAFYPIRISSSTNETQNIAIEGRCLNEDDTVQVSVTFVYSGGSRTISFDFDYNGGSNDLQYGTTAGFPHTDYTEIKFSLNKIGVPFYMNTFYVTHDIDVSQLGSMDFYGGARYASGTLTLPDNPAGHPNPQLSVNGTGSFWYKNVMPKGWLHYNSLYYTDTFGVWETAFRKKFLRHRKFNNVFKDLRDEFPSSPGTNNVGYAIGKPERRIIEITGTDSGRITQSRTSDWSPPPGETTTDRGYFRSYPDIAMWGQVLNSLTNLGGQNTISTINGWVKHSVQQSVPIPDGAYYIKYGAYVRCPEESPFDTRNFGQIEVSQDRGAGLQNSPEYPGNEREVWGDCVRFVEGQFNPTGSGALYPHFPFLRDGGALGTQPPLIQHTDSPRRTQYNWNGLASIYNFSDTPRLIASNINNVGPAWPQGFRYPTKLNVDGIAYDASPYKEFKLVEREWRGYRPAYDASPQGLRLAPNRRPFAPGNNGVSDELGGYNSSTDKQTRVTKLIAQDLMTNSNRHATDRVVLDSPPEFGIFFGAGIPGSNNAVLNERILVEVDSPNPSVFAPGTYYGKITSTTFGGLGSTTAGVQLERARFKSQAEISTDPGNDHSVLSISSDINSQNEDDYSVKVFRTKTDGQYMSPGVGVDKYQTYLKQVKYLKFELCFYEWSGNLTSIQPSLIDSKKSGKIQFFNPYVQFFGANDSPL